MENPLKKISQWQQNKKDLKKYLEKNPNDKEVINFCYFKRAVFLISAATISSISTLGFLKTPPPDFHEHILNFSFYVLILNLIPLFNAWHKNEKRIRELRNQFLKNCPIIAECKRVNR